MKPDEKAGALGWRELKVGCVITEPGSAAIYRTGYWRTRNPSFDKQRCVKCGLCYIYCPDMAIRFDADGYAESDLFYCKGCGICAQECWVRAITMTERADP